MDHHTKAKLTAGTVGAAATTLNGSIAAAPIEPLGVRIPDAVAISGVSRSGLYRAAARGEVIFLKHGDRIIVDYASLKAMHARLPRAVINVADA
jgi:hypothetical protein